MIYYDAPRMPNKRSPGLVVNARRIYGAHLTPQAIFRNYIVPVVKPILWSYVWVDMFAGEGDLVLPMLEMIPPRLRPSFFEKHIYLFDIQEEMVARAVERAVHLGVPRSLAERNIGVRDSLRDYPSFILEQGLPVYHVTNPPYLYLGYIRKHREAWRHLAYFTGANKGLQDLYQVALLNDARHGIDKMIYIVPTNFLYGYSVSNRARMMLLEKYRLRRAVVFEQMLFSTTGTHVALCFFERKEKPGHMEQVFEALKLKPGGQRLVRTYRLKPRYMYRAGAEFDEFVEKHRARRPLGIKFHLRLEDLRGMEGDRCISAIDANSFDRASRTYRRLKICLDEQGFRLVKSNILFLRTLDTGSVNGRAGIYVVREEFGVDAVIVTSNTYRTHPIHIVFQPQLSVEDQLLVKQYFNTMLEYLRRETDSEFMTTYKYSPRSRYTRKYLGLLQARRLLETLPLLDMDEDDKRRLSASLEKRDVGRVLGILREYSASGRPQHEYSGHSPNRFT